MAKLNLNSIVLVSSPCKLNLNSMAKLNLNSIIRLLTLQTQFELNLNSILAKTEKMRLPGAILLHYFSWFYAIKKGPKHRKPISNS